MIFLRPDLASWALVVPVIGAFWMLQLALRLRFDRRAPIAPRFAPLSRRSSRGRDVAVLGLASIEALGLVFAVVQPRARLTRRTPEYERQDLVVMLDRSASMRARDIVPSRFGRATLEIRNVVRDKPDGLDRVGLVGFADAAVILSYLTSDVDSVLFYFDWIDNDPTPLFGTNIGSALKSAMEVVKKDGRPGPDLPARVRRRGLRRGAGSGARHRARRGLSRQLHRRGIGSGRHDSDEVARRQGRGAARRCRACRADEILGRHAPPHRLDDRGPLPPLHDRHGAPSRDRRDPHERAARGRLADDDGIPRSLSLGLALAALSGAALWIWF